MSPIAIDTHFHVFPLPAAALPGARYVPTYAAEIGAWRALSAAAAITHGVIVQTSFLGNDNSALLAAIAADRNHLRGIAVVKPEVDDAELDRLHRAGIRGIRLNRFGDPALPDQDAAAWHALSARLARRGWHLELWAARGAMADLLDRVQPACDVVIDHYGAPQTEAADDPLWASVRALRHGCHVKLSAPYRLGELDRSVLLQRWLDAVGPEGLLWGSDWPWTNHERQQSYAVLLRDLLGRLGDPSLPERVLRDNPLRRYDFAQ